MAQQQDPPPAPSMAKQMTVDTGTEDGRFGVRALALGTLLGFLGVSRRRRLPSGNTTVGSATNAKVSAVAEHTEVVATQLGNEHTRASTPTGPRAGDSDAESDFGDGDDEWLDDWLDDDLVGNDSETQQSLMRYLATGTADGMLAQEVIDAGRDVLATLPPCSTPSLPPASCDAGIAVTSSASGVAAPPLSGRMQVAIAARSRDAQLDQEAAATVWSLDTVLADNEGRECVRSFCQDDACPERIEFLLAVTAWRNSWATRSDQSRQEAAALIIDAHLRPGAPMELRLPAVYGSVGASTSATQRTHSLDMFSHDAAAVYRALLGEMWPRFERSSPALLLKARMLAAVATILELEHEEHEEQHQPPQQRDCHAGGCGGDESMPPVNGMPGHAAALGAPPAATSGRGNAATMSKLPDQSSGAAISHSAAHARRLRREATRAALRAEVERRHPTLATKLEPSLEPRRAAALPIGTGQTWEGQASDDPLTVAATAAREVATAAHIHEWHAAQPTALRGLHNMWEAPPFWEDSSDNSAQALKHTVTVPSNGSGQQPSDPAERARDLVDYWAFKSLIISHDEIVVPAGLHAKLSAGGDGAIRRHARPVLRPKLRKLVQYWQGSPYAPESSQEPLPLRAPLHHYWDDDVPRASASTGGGQDAASCASFKKAYQVRLMAEREQREILLARLAAKRRMLGQRRAAPDVDLPTQKPIQSWRDGGPQTRRGIKGSPPSRMRRASTPGCEAVAMAVNPPTPRRDRAHTTKPLEAHVLGPSAVYVQPPRRARRPAPLRKRRSHGEGGPDDDIGKTRTPWASTHAPGSHAYERGENSRTGSVSESVTVGLAAISGCATGTLDLGRLSCEDRRSQRDTGDASNESRDDSLEEEEASEQSWDDEAYVEGEENVDDSRPAAEPLALAWSMLTGVWNAWFPTPPADATCSADTGSGIAYIEQQLRADGSAGGNDERAGSAEAQWPPNSTS